MRHTSHTCQMLCRKEESILERSISPKSLSSASSKCSPLLSHVQVKYYSQCGPVKMSCIPRPSKLLTLTSDYREFNDILLSLVTNILKKTRINCAKYLADVKMDVKCSESKWSVSIGSWQVPAVLTSGHKYHGQSLISPSTCYHLSVQCIANLLCSGKDQATRSKRMPMRRDFFRILAHLNLLPRSCTGMQSAHGW